MLPLLPGVAANFGAASRVEAAADWTWFVVTGDLNPESVQDEWTVDQYMMANWLGPRQGGLVPLRAFEHVRGVRADAAARGYPHAADHEPNARHSG
jgi:hypothetical protein